MAFWLQYLFINTLIHLLIDPVYPAKAVINMIDVCKWTENGIFIAGVQQMFFFAARYDFSSCVVICAAPLVWVADRRNFSCNHLYFHTNRSVEGILSGFFQIIMFNSNAILHIGICLLLSAALSFADLCVLKRKTFIGDSHD